MGRCTSFPGGFHLHSNQIEREIIQSVTKKPMSTVHMAFPIFQ